MDAVDSLWNPDNRNHKESRRRCRPSRVLRAALHCYRRSRLINPQPRRQERRLKMARPSLERASYVLGGYTGMGFSTARPSVVGGRSSALAARDPGKFAASERERDALGRTHADVVVE